MNIIDAIKSNAPFKRPAHILWMRVAVCHDSFALDDSGELMKMITPSDVIADDWIVREPAVQITSSQYWDAVKACDPGILDIRDGIIKYVGDSRKVSVFQRVAVKLGL